MDIPQERWYPSITKRHSRRQFEAGKAILPEIWQRLQMVSRTFKPFPGVRVELASAAVETIFKGALGPYGKVKDAPAYMAIIGDSNLPNFQEAAGYSAEGLILEATSMGLSTCWVAGFFNPYATAKQFPLQPGERILAVSPLGYSAQSKTLEEKLLSGFARSQKRVPLTQFVSGLDSARYPAWMPAALEAVRLAPSAMNRQPWRLYIESNSVLFSTSGGLSDFNVSKRLDCGISMLHFDIAARFHSVYGSWEFLEAPQVARFSFYNNLLK
jgi:nitroreductase